MTQVLLNLVPASILARPRMAAPASTDPCTVHWIPKRFSGTRKLPRKALPEKRIRAATLPCSSRRRTPPPGNFAFHGRLRTKSRSTGRVLRASPPGERPAISFAPLPSSRASISPPRTSSPYPPFSFQSNSGLLIAPEGYRFKVEGSKLKILGTSRVPMTVGDGTVPAGMIGVGKAHWFEPPLPPNRTCGSPASGSPVSGVHVGTDRSARGLRPW